MTTMLGDTRKRLFFDMDNVLVDFCSALPKGCCSNNFKNDFKGIKAETTCFFLLFT